MQVKSTTALNGRELVIELDGDDGVAAFGDKWKSWSLDQQTHNLSIYADIVALDYQKSINHIPSEFAKERVEQLVRKLHV